MATTLTCSVQLLRAAAQFTDKDRPSIDCVYVTPEWVVATDGIAMIALRNQGRDGTMPQFDDLLQSESEGGIYLDPEVISNVENLYSTNFWGGNQWPTFEQDDDRLSISRNGTVLQLQQLNKAHPPFPDFSAILRSVNEQLSEQDDEGVMFSVKQLTRLGHVLAVLYGSADVKGITIHTKIRKPCLITLPEHGFLVLMPVTGPGR